MDTKMKTQQRQNKRLQQARGHGHHVHGAWRRAALLLLVGVPLACDPTPTEPTSQAQAEAAISVHFPPVGVFSLFDNSQYYAIDVNRAAQQQYGPTARATQICDHLYCWRAVVNGQQYSIDMQRAVAQQWGSGYALGAVGVGIYDWRAVHWSALANEVLPVMPIASDYFWDVTAVQGGLANFRSVLVAVRNWYQLRAGKTFRLLQPLVVFLQSSQTAAQWNALSDSTAIDAHRYDFLNAVIAEYQRSYPAPSRALPLVLAPFTGNSPDVWLGAADYAGYAVAPPRATSITCPATGPLDYRCSDATYAIGHELGHAFGLQHSCTAYPNDPNCANSIMQVGKPWDAILLPGEITSLLATPFFF